MKKQRFFAFAAAALLAASSLAGCGGAQTAETSAAGTESAAASSNAATPDAHATDQTLASGISVGSTDAEAQKGGTLVISIPSSPQTLDPANFTLVYEQNIMTNVLDTLFVWDKDYKKVIPLPGNRLHRERRRFSLHHQFKRRCLLPEGKIPGRKKDDS